MNMTTLERYIRNPEDRRRAVGIVLTYVLTAVVVGALFLACCLQAKKLAEDTPVEPAPVPIVEWQQ